MTDNAPATIGDNSGDIDYAKQESDRLARDYPQIEKFVIELEAEEEKLPAKIEDDDLEMKGKVAAFVKKCRDAASRAKGLHELEGIPLYRRKQGVDNFFFGFIDRLAKRDKKNRDGLADRAMKLIQDFDDRALAAENERRRLAALEAQRVADALKAKEDEARRVAEDARLKAERARTAETQASKGEVAKAAEEAVIAVAGEASAAEARAEETYVATLVRPAEVLRHRDVTGTLSTSGREGYAEIIDDALLDKDKLWTFIPLDAKQKALTAYAKSRSFNADEKMPGAIWGYRNKSKVR